MAKLNVNKKALFDRMRKKFVWTMKYAGHFMQSYIVEEKRDFPNQTNRRFGYGVTGKLAGSPRDVVDSGETRDSFDIAVEYKGEKVIVTVKWDSKAAEYVYFGANQPPYPWVEIALRRLNLKQIYKEQS